MGVGGASRLFRDFVEKLERAYIAFDGVVGSCLGCAWGGLPTTTWTTTLTLFRETQNPISQNAPHSLSFFSSPLSSRRLTLLFLPFVLREQLPIRLIARPFLLLFLHLAFRFLGEGRIQQFVYPFIYELETSLSPSFCIFSAFLLIAYSDSQYPPLHVFPSSRAPVVGLDISSGMGKRLQ